MMDTIVIDYQPFSLASPAFTFKEGQVLDSFGVSSNIDAMSDELIIFCYAENIFNIKIDAPVDVLDNLENLIIQKENIKYSINKITVEGMQMR